MQWQIGARNHLGEKLRLIRDSAGGTTIDNVSNLKGVLGTVEKLGNFGTRVK